jgi:Rps23 Pro-64 3,4-dihydroxylase Tpa1-like proline 4-hydroxylase
MTIVEAKEKLKKEGYTAFELSDFDNGLYNFFEKFKCNEQTNLKEICTTLRVDTTDSQLYRHRAELISHEAAVEKKNELIELIEKEKLNLIFGQSKDKFDIMQIWYYADLSKILPQYNYITKETNKDYYYLKNRIKNMMTYFFDFEETQDFVFFSPTFTYYDTGCVLKNHSDGTNTGRVCALLIYLNEEYDENDGGILILNDEEKVVPKFGKVAIIDLQSFDIKHQVTKVTGGIGRYAFLTFIKTKENEFLNH